MFSPFSDDIRLECGARRTVIVQSGDACVMGDEVSAGTGEPADSLWHTPVDLKRGCVEEALCENRFEVLLVEGMRFCVHCRCHGGATSSGALWEISFGLEQPTCKGKAKSHTMTQNCRAPGTWLGSSTSVLFGVSALAPATR